MINLLEKEKTFNGFIFFVSSIEFLCVLTVCVIDSYLHVEIVSAAAFAYGELFSGAPFNLKRLGEAMIVFACFYGLCALVVYIILKYQVRWSRERWPKIIRKQNLAILLFELIHQSLFCAWVSCINNMSQFLIKIRCLMVILFIITCLIYTVYLAHVLKQNENRGESSKNASFNYLLLVVLFVLNIISMAMMEPGNNDLVTVKDIKIGIFNDIDFVNVINGSYVKDSTYSTRILTDLDTLVNSKQMKNGPTVCDSEGCGVSYYYLYTTVKIDCGSDAAKKVFYECKKADSVFITFEYQSNGYRYPTYGCAYLLNGRCTNCYLLTSFVQERSDNVEPAWKGFSKFQKPIKNNYRLTADGSLSKCTT